MNLVRCALVNTGMRFTDEEVAMIQATISPFSLELCRLIATHPALTIRSAIEAKRVMQSLLADAKQRLTDNANRGV
jgi:hypothetical protein